NKAMQEEVSRQKETREILVQEKSAQVALYDKSIAGQKEEVAKYMKAEAEAEAIIAAAENNASNSSTSTYTGGIFTWPVPSSNRITSYFGGRDAPVAGASTYHKGIDIACNMGDPIVAASDGTVIVSTYNYAEGNYICIDHGGGVVTLYMHNSQLLVSVGETVTAGQTIAAAGSTGYSNGPHCHFGVRIDGVYMDPLGYLQ
ncbi:MAG: M23 family metallopeptidase, partial [Lachnospiraceae bacterium]|nr:M23 family metallopeptidase [Lachnospiraceae bacterium]